ncbi:hypothetical protein H4R18_004191 [Coemansia javaensis]|uniref:SAP domain-containing protein n=1 Tax=Coemansia javaensis TaxID=2761396 RepID=A0A9W8H8E5_9FUNG|nr:hypothetical protein H4R18_004191 [Coemansia javaensis]
MLRPAVARQAAVAVAAARWGGSKRRAVVVAASYSTDAGDKEGKRGVRTKYMGLRPLSPAIESMAGKIGEQAAGPAVVDVEAEIERLRFTAADLLRDLPKYSASELGSAGAMASGGDLAAVSREAALDAVRAIRRARGEAIRGMFRADQLREYLRRHGRRTSGTKGELAERIIGEVWGTTVQAVEARLAAAEERAEGDGLSMALSDEAAAQVEQLVGGGEGGEGGEGGGALAAIEREFGVAIAVDRAGQTLRVTGRMGDARAALSTLRERLAASTTVELDLARHGRPRALAAERVQRICSAVSRAFGGDGTATCFDGGIFARGRTRADALDVQQALVDALVEPAHGALLLAVVPAALAGARAATVVPAADMVSKPRAFVPNRQLFVDPAAAPPPPPRPADVLAAHALFRRDPAQDGIAGPAAGAGATVSDALRAWAMQAGSLSFGLGRVLFDLGDGASVDLGLRRPHEVLADIGRRQPLFAFSGSVSPLRWLHGQTPQQQQPQQPQQPQQHRRQLALTFRRLPDAPAPAPAGSRLSYALPPPTGEKLVARIDVEAGRAQYGAAQIERISGERVARVAILQSAHDVEAVAAERAPVEASGELVAALQAAVRALGLAAAAANHAPPQRHAAIDVLGARYALAAAELDRVVDRPLPGGAVARVHQVWDIVDGHLYSRVEIHPHDLTDWDQLMHCVFDAAGRSPAIAAR